MKILLDTTALIDLMKNNENLIKKLEELKGKGCFIFTTTVNLYEVLAGIKILKSDQDDHLEALEKIKMNLYILNFDELSAQRASKIYAELRKKGKEINEEDYLIAGISLNSEIKTIITRNKKHFENINGLEVIDY